MDVFNILKKEFLVVPNYLANRIKYRCKKVHYNATSRRLFLVEDFSVSMIQLKKNEFLTPKLFIKIVYQTVNCITFSTHSSIYLYLIEAENFIRFNTITYEANKTKTNHSFIHPENSYLNKSIHEKYALLYKTQQTYELYKLDDLFTDHDIKQIPFKLCIPLLYSSKIVSIINIDEFKFQTVHTNGIMFIWDVRYPLNPIRTNQNFYKLLTMKKKTDKIGDTITNYNKLGDSVHYFTTYKYKLYIYNEISNVVYLYDNFKYKLVHLKHNYFLGYRDKIMEIFKLRVNGLKSVVRIKINLEIKDCLWIDEYKQICIIGKYIKFYCFNK